MNRFCHAVSDAGGFVYFGLSVTVWCKFGNGVASVWWGETLFSWVGLWVVGHGCAL